MPTRVLLEGPAIEPLLAQVREEYGSGVRIISADKVRSGGFGGFFAKQHYELSVEVPDEAENRNDLARNRPPVAAAPQTLEQLLERAEARDHIAGADDETHVIGRTQGRDAGIGDTEAAAAGGLPARSGLMGDGHNAFADLMAGLDKANALAAAAPMHKRPPLRPSPIADRAEVNRAETKRAEVNRPDTSRADLNRADTSRADLNRADTSRADLSRGGLSPADTGREEKPDSGVVRPFRPSTATGSPVNGSSSAAVKPLPPVPSLAELMGGLGLAEVDTVPPADSVGTAHRPLAVPPRSALSAAAAYGRSMAEAPAVAAPVSRVAITSGAEIVIANLLRVGLPLALAETITGGDTYAGVLTALSSRPAAPAVPDGPGEILVLVGDLTHALTSARQCLEQIGLDGAHLLLAAPSAAGTGIHSSKVVPGPEEAKRRAEKLHTADSAWVVAMEAPVGSTNSAWVRETCEAIGATAVWAVVDATRKTADTEKHLKLLGEIEAVVVHGVDNTGDPATVLGLGAPVVSLDGKPATPHAWAAMLCARIATDVTPPPAPARRPPRGR